MRRRIIGICVVTVVLAGAVYNGNTDQTGGRQIASVTDAADSSTCSNPPLSNDGTKIQNLATFAQSILIDPKKETLEAAQRNTDSSGNCLKKLGPNELSTLQNISELHEGVLAGADPKAAAQRIMDQMKDLAKTNPTAAKIVALLAAQGMSQSEQQHYRTIQDKLTAGVQLKPAEQRFVDTIQTKGLKAPQAFSTQVVTQLEAAGAILDRATGKWNFGKFDFWKLKTNADLRNAFLARYPEAIAQIGELEDPDHKDAVFIGDLVVMPTYYKRIHPHSHPLAALSSDEYRRQVDGWAKTFQRETEDMLRSSKEGGGWTDLTKTEGKFYKDLFTSRKNLEARDPNEDLTANENAAKTSQDIAGKSLAQLRQRYGIPRQQIDAYLGQMAQAVQQSSDNQMAAEKSMAHKAYGVIASPACILAPPACLTGIALGGAAIGISAGFDQAHAAGAGSYLCRLAEHFDEQSGDILLYSAILAPASALRGFTTIRTLKNVGLSSSVIRTTAIAATLGSLGWGIGSAAKTATVDVSALKRQRDAARAAGHDAEADAIDAEIDQAYAGAVQNVAMSLIPLGGFLLQKAPVSHAVAADTSDANGGRPMSNEIPGVTTAVPGGTPAGREILSPSEAGHSIDQMNSQQPLIPTQLSEVAYKEVVKNWDQPSPTKKDPRNPDQWRMRLPEGTPKPTLEDLNRIVDDFPSLQGLRSNIELDDVQMAKIASRVYTMKARLRSQLDENIKSGTDSDIKSTSISRSSMLDDRVNERVEKVVKRAISSCSK